MPNRYGDWPFTSKLFIVGFDKNRYIDLLKRIDLMDMHYLNVGVEVTVIYY